MDVGHDGRDISAVECSASYQVRMQKNSEKDNHTDMLRYMFADMINLNWANISFNQLAYDEKPSDLVYKRRLEHSVGLKKDSCSSTTIVHQKSSKNMIWMKSYN